MIEYNMRKWDVQTNDTRGKGAESNSWVIAKIKDLIQKKKAEQEVEAKETERKLELERRKLGQNITQSKEELDKIRIQKEVEARQREKIEEAVNLILNPEWEEEIIGKMAKTPSRQYGQGTCCKSYSKVKIRKIEHCSSISGGN